MVLVILNVAVWRVRGVLPPLKVGESSLVFYYAHALVFLSPPKKKREKNYNIASTKPMNGKNHIDKGIVAYKRISGSFDIKNLDKVCNPKVIAVT